jgi:glycine cleavage system aminomethyltransferase T
MSTLAPGRVRYALLCNESGGVIDDLTVYRTAPTRSSCA